jgi:DNA recombination protein RmuC
LDQQTLAALAAAAAIGHVIGVFVTWLILRSKYRAQQEAAVAIAQATYQGTLSAAQARLEQAEALTRTTQQELQAARAQGDRWRDELDTARDQSTKFEERAARIPELEGEVRRLGEKLAESQGTLLDLTASEADKARELQSLTEQVPKLETEVARLVQELAVATAALQTLGETKAAFETTAARVPGLDAKVADFEAKLAAANKELNDTKEALGTANATLDGVKKALEQLTGQHADEKRLREAGEAAVNALSSEAAGLRERLSAEQEAAAQKLAVLNTAQEALTAQFKALAGDILDANSKRFAEQNQAGLSQILDPLRQRIVDFQKKVEDVYVEEGKDRSALKEQVRQLVSLNQALSEDAKNLTSALRGSAKSQGNWGELILERVLEASGLRKDEEYFVQDSQTSEDGKRQQPDVVINLPEQRRLVVDSKVSLVGYERLASAADDSERDKGLRQHLDSVRTHVKGLSEKRYQNLYGQSLDFVLMFVPIEPAFMVAVTNDQQLFMDAWERNVLLVSPSTLLFVVRTVAHLWRQEAQNRNAQEIAKRGAELYDRLVGFVEDLRSVGDKLSAAQTAYTNAEKRLSTGKGNVIRQAEMLRELGVKPTKQLNRALVDVATPPADGPVLGATTEPAVVATEVDSSGAKPQ